MRWRRFRIAFKDGGLSQERKRRVQSLQLLAEFFETLADHGILGVHRTGIADEAVPQPSRIAFTALIGRRVQDPISVIETGADAGDPKIPVGGLPWIQHGRS